MNIHVLLQVVAFIALNVCMWNANAADMSYAAAVSIVAADVAITLSLIVYAIKSIMRLC